MWVYWYNNYIYNNNANYLLDEVHGDKAKASVRGQCDKYLVRAEELKEYIRKKRKKASKMVEGGGSSSKSKKKWELYKVELYEFFSFCINTNPLEMESYCIICKNVTSTHSL